MSEIRNHLQNLQKIKKHVSHPLLYKIHKKHKISKKTLFYIKEYGPHTHVPRTIIRESIKILLLASIISSFGGFAIEHMKSVFVSIIPLIILLPTLNDMIGDYGTIVSSKFSTFLHEDKIRKRWWKEEIIKNLFSQILIVAMITAVLSLAASFIIASISTGNFELIVAMKVFFIVLIDVALLVSILFIVAIVFGLHVYKKREDPNNFLIPITTSIADFGNMIILAMLVFLFF